MLNRNKRRKKKPNRKVLRKFPGKGSVRNSNYNFSNQGGRQPSRLNFRGIGFPDHFYTNLVYNFGGYHIQATTAVGNLLVAGNSAFDPDKTGSGHQPLYFDQLTTLYTRYRIRESQILISISQATQASLVSLTPTIDSTTPANLQDAEETPYNMVMINPTTVYANSLSNTMDTSTIWGVPPSTITSDDLYQALVSTDPTRIWYWKIQTTTYDGTTNMDLWLNVRVEYSIEFYGRVNPSQS